MAGANKLTQLQITRLKAPGLYGDGAGLWLNVTEGGSKSWVLRYTQGGKERRAGLGPFPEVTLAEARESAVNFRRQLRNGQDPVQEKRQAKAAAQAEQAKSVTFDWCAEKYIAAHKPSWKNPKHGDQWTNTIATYVSPIMGSTAVDRIETTHIMRVLEPIWTTKAETASRVRGRIESILSWAAVRKFRSGENPARWKGHLDSLLPARKKIARVQHHPALPWQDMSAFMAELKQQAGVGALALQFSILTAARSGEVRGMTWDEVNLDDAVWIIPGERMKAGRDHRVPLSTHAKAILTSMEELKLGDTNVVFPGVRDRKPLSDMTLTAVLKRMERTDITVHGFRSTFRDWAAEVTHYPREMAEMALAHTVSDQVEAAYRRGDMFEKRRQMMADWDAFCHSTASK
jgi:integrase